jgi:putative transposase
MFRFCFVSGRGFSRAKHTYKKNWALALHMARPLRNANSAHILSSSRTFFVTTKTSLGRALQQSERNATLLIEVLRSYLAARKFRVHDFLVMPDHLHLLITVGGDTTIEKAMQFVKGGFSYRLKKDFGYVGEVWQSGFSEVRVDDRDSFLRHRKYIAENPAKAGLASTPETFPYCFTYLAKQKQQGLKPDNFCAICGTAQAVP